MRTPHLASLLVVLLALGTACEREGAEDEGTAADTTAAEESGMGMETEPAPAEPVSYQVVVTNPMPHAMNVTATLPDGSQVQLGTVPASGESSFEVTGAAGESVTITATDEENTHSPSGTVTLPVGETTVRWTVQ